MGGKLIENGLRGGTSSRLISLWNNDEEIVGCGKFFDFPRHSSVHDLSPSRGLQIVGILGENVKEKALLGFYQLGGVKHTGEVPSRLKTKRRRALRPRFAESRRTNSHSTTGRRPSAP